MNKIDLLGECVRVLIGEDDRVEDGTRSQHDSETCRREEKMQSFLLRPQKMLHACPPHYADYNLLQKVQYGRQTRGGVIFRSEG
jgi:hypothetical protein